MTKTTDGRIEAIRDYYGKVLESKNDLKTTACCSSEEFPNHLKPVVGMIHEDVRKKFYGCGVPVPPAVEGCTVLDLGCGTGRDCFLFSHLVGSSGRVIGVDMTDEQLDVARQNVAYHTDQFGYAEPNVQFLKGYMEDLQSLDIADNSVDLVVSNCVFNLSPDKEKLFSEIFRVLKPGGELYFSDVFADRRLSESAQQDPLLLGECLGGAMYIQDFRRLLFRLGCPDYRVVSTSEVAITSEEVRQKVGPANFSSLTVRAFKLDLEDRCEDYGQVAYYLGGLKGADPLFTLDDHHVFEKGRPMLVCSNTAGMVAETRYAPYFKVLGDTSVHYGLFDCSQPSDSASSGDDSGNACC